MAKKNGKRLAIACAPADEARWAQSGVDLLFCGGNISCLRAGVESILKQAAALKGLKES